MVGAGFSPPVSAGVLSEALIVTQKTARPAAQRRQADSPERQSERRQGNGRRISALIIALLVTLLNFLLWWAFNPPLPATDAPPRVAGLAYNGFQRWGSPLTQHFPSDTELAADLRQLAGMTTRLRTYSASELPALPALAAQQGLG